MQTQARREAACRALGIDPATVVWPSGGGGRSKETGPRAGGALIASVSTLSDEGLGRTCTPSAARGTAGPIHDQIGSFLDAVLKCHAPRHLGRCPTRRRPRALSCAAALGGWAHSGRVCGFWPMLSPSLDVSARMQAPTRATRESAQPSSDRARFASRPAQRKRPTVFRPRERGANTTHFCLLMK